MILTFGEIMMRLKTPGFLRFQQSMPGALDATFGGGEANVAASLAMLGNSVRFLTALPDHTIGDCVTRTLKGLDIDTTSIHRASNSRLGIYFLEAGANQRSSVVVYDRAYSAIAQTPAEAYDFDTALDGVTWVHTTGITPAISEQAFQSTLFLLKKAKEKGCRVSCDLNFRKKLWKWQPETNPKDLARKCMAEILPYVDISIGNEEDAEDVLDIHAEGTSVESGQINAVAYKDVASKIACAYPNLSFVAITLRESISATHNNWGAMLYDVANNQSHFAPLDDAGNYTPYEIRDIVDRVGGGDSFGAGLIHAMNSVKYSQPEKAIQFAVAASCLKHSIMGDINYIAEKEVVTLMDGSGSGRVQR